MPPSPLAILAGVVITLTFFGLIAYIVRLMVRSNTHVRLTGTLTAMAALLTAYAGVLYALYGI